MPYKSFQFLRDQAKKHSDRALRYFSESTEIYEEIKKMPPHSPERDEALKKIIELGAKASTEVKKAIAFSDEFIAEYKRYENRDKN